MARTANARDKGLEVPDHPDLERLQEGFLGGLPPLISPARLAKLLDLGRQRIYDLIASGDIAATRIGSRRLRIYRESVAEWLRRGGCP